MRNDAVKMTSETKSHRRSSEDPAWILVTSAGCDSPEVLPLRKSLDFSFFQVGILFLQFDGDLLESNVGWWLRVKCRYGSYLAKSLRV